MFALVASASSVWLAALILAPVLPTAVSSALYLLGSEICHQRPERSFHLFAVQLPVCARCLGIYAGAALGSVVMLSARVRGPVTERSARMLLVMGAIPTAVTLVVEWSGASALSNSVRGAAGAALGLAVAFVVGQGVATLHYGGCASRRPIASNRPATPI